MFSGVNVQDDLRHYHPFGCPVFVLSSGLQSPGSQIPKWDPRARVGIYLGHSPCHAGLVALVLNPKTLRVSPQYHVVFDDDFTTVPYMKNGEIPPNWSQLVTASIEVISDDDFNLATASANDYINDKEPLVNEEDMSSMHNAVTPSMSSLTSEEEEINIPEEASDPISLEDSQSDSLLFPTMPDLYNLTRR